MSGMKRSIGIYYYEDDDILNWIKFDKVIKYSSYYKCPRATTIQVLIDSKAHKKVTIFISFIFKSRGKWRDKKTMTINWHELFWRKFI